MGEALKKKMKQLQEWSCFAKKITMEEKLKRDEEKDKIVKVACRKCDSSTNHKILSSIGSSWGEEEIDLYGFDDFEIVVCLGCDTVSFRVVSTDSDTIDLNSEGRPFHVETVILYPNRIAGRKQIENMYLLPDDVIKIYHETHGALSSGFNILAGIGIRALVESVCKEKKATGRDLEKKIDNLILSGVLTREGADILHKTRLLGNRSAHEIIEPKYQELEIGMDIVENLLNSVYIIPKRSKRLNIVANKKENPKSPGTPSESKADLKKGGWIEI